ncbi:YjgN family protein [Thermaurantiacus sp.]
MSASGAEGEPRVHFAGRAGPFLLMQLWRAFLSVITLGIHRFWWKTANRRRLWEETTIDGDPLEYRGRGIELFKGFVIAFLLVFLPLGALAQLPQLLQLSGASEEALVSAALLVPLVLLPAIGLLLGYAVWRARRYLLSRTAWRGIRAGLEGSGWRYARLNFAMLALKAVTLGLATPYADARRWNALWNDARFGTEAFRAKLNWGPLFKPWLISLGLAVALVLVPLLLALPTLMGVMGAAELPAAGRVPAVAPWLAMLVPFIGFAVFLGVVTLILPLAFVPWRAAFLSAAAGATRLGDVGFAFAATRSQWLRYLLGNAALVILTLGVGALLLPWRQWAFWITHLRIEGVLDEGRIRQSQLAAPSHGEGLAEGFDLGGI